MSFEFGPFYSGKIPAAHLVPALALGMSLTALAAAYGSQYWGGLTPCVLCLYQRAAYGAVTLFAAGALGFLNSTFGVSECTTCRSCQPSLSTSKKLHAHPVPPPCRP